MAEFYEYATGPNRHWVNVPGIGEFEVMVDESQKKMVVSDEGYWNPKSPVGENLKKAVKWANDQGYQGGVVVTPYAFIDGKATESQLKEYIDSSDFVVVDPYSSLRDDPEYAAKADQISNVTKAINEYANSVDKRPWLVLQNFTVGDQTPEEVIKFNKKILKDNEGLFDTVSFFNKADFGSHESTANVGQIDNALTGKLLQDFNIKPDQTTIKNYVDSILSSDLSDTAKQQKIKETAELYGLNVTQKADVSALTPISYIGNPDADAADVVDLYGKQVVLPNGQVGTALYDTSGNLAGMRTVVGDTITTYSPTGDVRSVESMKGDFLTDLAPVIAMGASVLGAPYVSGLLSSVAPSALAAGTAANAAATGAVLGGGSAAITGNDILKGALLGGLGGYASNALSGATTPTDLGMNSNLTMAQIESGLGTPGYGYGAQAASSGLFNPAVIGSGAYTQTSYPHDMADLLAADALQLQGQVGNNLPAIEQNLVASGVDPLIAADVSGNVALNPSVSQYDLTNYINTNLGGNLYDVNTSALQSTNGAGGSPANATTTGSNITLNDVMNAVKVGSLVAGAVGSASGGSSDSGFDIVPVPSDWKTPLYEGTKNFPALPQIDFGSRELLRGTQWEKYLNPQAATSTVAPKYQSVQDIVNAVSGNFAPIEQVKTYANEPLTGIAAYKPTPFVSNINDVIGIINSDKNISDAEAKALQLMTSPSLSDLPSEAASAIANAVSNPRSYSDVVSSGVASPSNLSSMSPEIQKAWDVYQQSMVLGAPRYVAEAAYKAAGVDPTNPTGFFESLGFNAGTPTQEALAKYAPLALDQFAKSGGGALTFTVDPTTIPTGYVAPKVPTLANNNMNSYVRSLLGSDFAAANPARAQELIAARATELGLDPSIYVTGTNG
jgi:hypothetical protein